MARGYRQSRAAAALGMLLALYACAYALDPSLDVSHRVRVKDAINAADYPAMPVPPIV